MKKFFSIALAFIMLVSMFSVCASARTLNLIDNDNHGEVNLLNPIANVQTVSGSDIEKIVSDSKNLSVALFDASETEDIAALLTLCKNEGVVPTFQIESEAEADKIVDAMGSKASKVKDVTAIASDAALLKYIREKSVFVRTGLIIDLQQNTLTSEEAHAIRTTVRSAPATFCVIESTNASKQAVAELQALAVAVWVRVASAPDTDEFTVEAIKAVTSGANGIISSDANALTAVINANLSENAMTRTSIMIGHRGNPTQAPENSLSGFITAYENGADIFEIDVEVASDGEIIVLHDGTLNRTTNYTGTKNVSQMTLAEIKEYKLLGLDGNTTDETVPTLREVLDEFKDKDCRIFVEFKGSNARNVAATSAIIKECGMEDRVDVISFNAKFLTQTQQNLPGMSTGFLGSYDLKSTTYEDAIDSMYRAMSDAQKVNSTINIGSGTFSAHFEQAATDRGMTVWPWTYLTNSNNSAFIAGCDGLTTDDVQWAKNMAKYIETDLTQIELSVNGTVPFAVNAVTYGGETVGISSDKYTVTVLTGNDCIAVNNGEINGAKTGTATVVYGYPTKTASGSEYVLYTQPVTVKVTAAAADTNADASQNTDSDLAMYTVIAIVAAVGIIVAVVYAITQKKK